MVPLLRNGGANVSWVLTVCQASLYGASRFVLIDLFSLSAVNTGRLNDVPGRTAVVWPSQGWNPEFSHFRNWKDLPGFNRATQA